uniref:AB hydrolase-1 domain-containing protein n=1 Tax=Colletotrichum fructicola (strain Nara gc5) TaxID=1213859 RepID=L2GBV1_COLFN
MKPSVLIVPVLNPSIVALPTVGGTTTPLASLSDDVAAVRTELDKLVSDGKEVVIYSHSYGGVVASNAVEGYDVAPRTAAAGSTGGVVSIVYASAFMLPKGSSLLDLLGGTPLPWMVVEGDRVVGNATMLPEVGFNDLPASEQEKWASQMTWTALGAFTNASSYEPWSNGIDCAYLYATLDNALPLSYQQGMSAVLPAGSKTESEPSGHCAHLSRPSNVTSILSRWYPGN